MTERLLEINQEGHNIRCALFTERKGDYDALILFCHGFAGYKDNGQAKNIIERVLSKYPRTAALAFDWPCHGADVKKKLCLADCYAYLRLVTQYARQTYPSARLLGYGTSFGAFIQLAYSNQYGNPFEKLVLRSPAINLYDSITERIISAAELEKIQKGKTVPVGFDRKVNVEDSFLRELRQTDLREMSFIDEADNILLIHGTKDEIIPYSIVRDFSEDNVMELISVDGADHRFQHPAHQEAAIKALLAFFVL